MTNERLMAPLDLVIVYIKVEGSCTYVWSHGPWSNRPLSDDFMSNNDGMHDHTVSTPLPLHHQYCPNTCPCLQVLYYCQEHASHL